MWTMSELDKIQRKALEIALAGHNVIITGPPGTGKTSTMVFIIKKILSERKKVRMY